jgi:predicted lipoprotein with Yx(FWY)xxD motif
VVAGVEAVAAVASAPAAVVISVAAAPAGNGKNQNEAFKFIHAIRLHILAAGPAPVVEACHGRCARQWPRLAPSQSGAD